MVSPAKAFDLSLSHSHVSGNAGACIGFDSPELSYADLDADQNLFFHRLIAQYGIRLHRFVIKQIGNPTDAADIAQHTFAEAARTISTFRGESEFSTWLFGIAMNMVRNYLNRSPHRLYEFETEEVLSAMESTAIDPYDSMAQKQLLEHVEAAIADLPSDMAEILVLITVDEMSYEDAASRLSIPLGTVRSRVSRARAMLRSRLEKKGISPTA